MKKFLLLTILAITLIVSPVLAEFKSDIIITSPNGIWTDSRAYTTLNDAVAAVGANERTIKIVSPQTVTILTVPSTVTLEFERDGSITNSGQLTINTKNIIAPNRQIFTGVGNIDFATGSTLKTGWFSNIETAFALTSNDEVTLVVSKPQSITANFSPGNDVHLKWEDPGNILTINAGRIVGNLKNIEAGNYQIFAGAGDFDFLDGTELKLNWFNRLESALTWVENEKVTIVINEDSIVQTNSTAASNEHIKVVSGGELIPDAGVTLTINSFESEPHQVFSGAGTIAWGFPITVYSEWWGAVGDGITNDSTAIQAAIDSLEIAKGGTVQFLAKTYKCNIEAKSYVELKGASPMFKGSSVGVQSHNKTYLKANATGHIITTSAGAVYDITVRNLGLIGLGSGTALKGLYLQNVGRSLFEDLAFDNIADEAIRINDGNPNHFRRIFAQNCLLDRTQAVKIGVFHVEFGADDQWISNCEFTASSTSLSDANAYICAVVIDSSNNFLSNVVGEISDIGIHITANGDRNRFTACRADINYSHGYEIAGSGNLFVNCYSLSNGHDANDTYDGFHITAGGNIFTGSLAESYVADTEKHRYGFYDSVDSNTNRNIYSNCNSLQHISGWFTNNGASYGSGPHTPQLGPFIGTADNATPSVGGFQLFRLNNYTTAVTITNFDDGTAGQTIYIIDESANGYVTIDHGTNIFTASGTDLKMAQRVVYTFVNRAGYWYQLGNRHEQETATGAFTLSPESATVIDSSGGAVSGTLGNGTYIGQIKTIVMTDATTSSTVSITNHQTSDPEVATFDAVDETGVFMWTGTEWITIFATCTFV